MPSDQAQCTGTNADAGPSVFPSTPYTHLTPLETLRRQYFSLLPPRLISLTPASQLASADGQKFMLSCILQDDGIDEDEAAAISSERIPQPETGYRRLFWRKVMREMEVGLAEVQLDDEEAEIDDRFYQILADLMAVPSSDASEPPPSFRTFIYNRPNPPGLANVGSHKSVQNEGTITLLEEQTVLQAGTTGLRTWTAALHLGAHVLLRPHLLLGTPSTSSLEPPLSGKHFVELGAGTGFLAVLISQLGGEVVATDLNDGDESDSEREAEEVGDGKGGVSGMGKRQTPLARLRENVERNMGCNVTVQSLDWFDALRPLDERSRIWHDLCSTSPSQTPAEAASSSSATTGEASDRARNGRTVIAADVIYDPDLVPALVATIKTLIQPAGQVADDDQIPAGQAIIAATVRNEETLRIFEETCDSMGLVVETVNLPQLSAETPVFWDSGLDAGSDVRVMRVTVR